MKSIYFIKPNTQMFGTNQCLFIKCHKLKFFFVWFFFRYGIIKMKTLRFKCIIEIVTRTIFNTNFLYIVSTAIRSFILILFCIMITNKSIINSNIITSKNMKICWHSTSNTSWCTAAFIISSHLSTEWSIILPKYL